ncbi:mRNA 3'-end-processing protein rna14, partial [Blyttiomyces sp. JEL0837]
MASTTDLQQQPSTSTSSSTQSQPHLQSIPDKWKARLTKDPYDTDAWSLYLQETIQNQQDRDATRVAFEALLTQFPTSTRHWIAYLDFEQKANELDRLESLFTRSLRTIQSIDLWKHYLSYIRKIHTPSSASTPEKKLESRQVILKAFESVLANVGMDKESGAIWADYIAFIKAGE